MNFAEALDEITRLRQECNGYEEELASLRAELKAVRDRWAGAFSPPNMTIPMGTATAMLPQFTTGRSTAWTPVSGTFTLNMDSTSFSSATGLPSVMQLGSGSSTESFAISNVTFEGTKISPTGSEATPPAA